MRITLSQPFLFWLLGFYAVSSSSLSSSVTILPSQVVEADSTVLTVSQSGLVDYSTLTKATVFLPTILSSTISTSVTDAGGNVFPAIIGPNSIAESLRTHSNVSPLTSLSTTTGNNPIVTSSKKGKSEPKTSTSTYNSSNTFVGVVSPGPILTTPKVTSRSNNNHATSNSSPKTATHTSGDLDLISVNPATVSVVTTVISGISTNKMATITRSQGKETSESIVPFLSNCPTICPTTGSGLLVFGIGPSPGVYFMNHPPVPSLYAITIGHDNKPTPAISRPEKSAKPDGDGQDNSEKGGNNRDGGSQEGGNKGGGGKDGGDQEGGGGKDGGGKYGGNKDGGGKDGGGKDGGGKDGGGKDPPAGDEGGKDNEGNEEKSKEPSKTTKSDSTKKTSTSSCRQNTSTGCFTTCSPDRSTSQCSTTCSTITGCTVTATNSATTEACELPNTSGFPFAFGPDGLAPLRRAITTPTPSPTEPPVPPQSPTSVSGVNKPNYCLPTFSTPKQCNCMNGTTTNMKTDGICPNPLPSLDSGNLFIWHYIYQSIINSTMINTYEISQSLDISLPLQELRHRSRFSLATEDAIDKLPQQMGPFEMIDKKAESCTYRGKESAAGDVTCAKGLKIKCLNPWAGSVAHKRDESGFEIARLIVICSNSL